jgi:hypothetical protein
LTICPFGQVNSGGNRREIQVQRARPIKGWLDQKLCGLADRAYLVSVDDLREICSGLTDGEREYKLTCDDEKTVALSYNDGPDDLNSVMWRKPSWTI